MGEGDKIKWTGTKAHTQLLGYLGLPIDYFCENQHGYYVGLTLHHQVKPS